MTPTDPSPLDANAPINEAALFDHKTAAPGPLIAPTLGRIVLVTLTKTDAEWHCGFRGPDDDPRRHYGPFSAILTGTTDDDRLIDVTLFPPGRMPIPLLNVPLLQAGDEVPGDRSYASWMPHQLGQAQATADLAERMRTVREELERARDSTRAYAAELLRPARMVVDRDAAHEAAVSELTGGTPIPTDAELRISPLVSWCAYVLSAPHDKITLDAPNDYERARQRARELRPDWRGKTIGAYRVGTPNSPLNAPPAPLEATEPRHHGDWLGQPEPADQRSWWRRLFG